MNLISKLRGDAILALFVAIVICGCSPDQSKSTSGPGFAKGTQPDTVERTIVVELVPIDSQGLESWIQSQPSQLVLVDYWATWCSPCVEKFPQVMALRDNYAGSDLAITSVCLNEPSGREEAIAFLSKCGVSSSQWIAKLPSSDAFEDFQLEQLPTYRLFDRAGNVLETFSGEINLADVAARIETHLKPGLKK